jgi:hypothetical protein
MDGNCKQHNRNGIGCTIRYKRSKQFGIGYVSN